MVRRAELSRPTISRGVAIAFAGLAAVVALAYLGFSLAEQSLDVREWFKPPDLPSFAEPQGAQKITEYIGPFAGGRYVREWSRWPHNPLHHEPIIR